MDHGSHHHHDHEHDQHHRHLICFQATLCRVCRGVCQLYQFPRASAQPRFPSLSALIGRVGNILNIYMYILILILIYFLHFFLPESQIQFSHWLCEHYHHPLIGFCEVGERGGRGLIGCVVLWLTNCRPFSSFSSFLFLMVMMQMMLIMCSAVVSQSLPFFFLFQDDDGGDGDVQCSC